MDKLRTLLCASLFQSLLCISNAALAAPEVGWWWNPNESGRGFFIESQNGIVFLAGYLYEADGRAMWLVSGAQNADPYNYSGRLSALRGGQTIFGDYQVPVGPTDAGAVSFHFDDDSHGTLTIADVVIPIERQRFGGDPLPAQPDSGWWWNPGESGRGYSIEVQGNVLDIVAFMYDDAGNPVWYLSAGAMDSPTTYHGPWLQFANGQTLGSPYKLPSAPVTVGQLSVEFTAIDEATLTFSEVTAAGAGAQSKAGKIVTVPAKRQFPAQPKFRPAGHFGGIMTIQVLSLDAPLPGGLMHIDGWLTASVGFMPAELPPVSPTELRGPVYRYDLDPNSFATFRSHISLHAPKADCEGSLTQDAHYTGDTQLAVNGYGQYEGRVGLSYTGGVVTIACHTAEGDDQQSWPIVGTQTTVALGGKLGNDPDNATLQVIAGSLPPPISAEWKFVGYSP